MTALAKPPVTLTVAGLGLPFGKAEIEIEHANDRHTLAAMSATKVRDEDELALADAQLSSVMTLESDLVARRQEPLKRTKALIAEVESWFRPYLKDVQAAKAGLKAAIGAYQLQKAEAAEAARRAAREAADAGKSNAVLSNIQEAQALERKGEERSSVSYAWEVKRIAEDLLPDAFWSPDREKIAAEIAKQREAFGADAAPVIPGVVFERVAVVRGRR